MNCPISNKAGSINSCCQQYYDNMSNTNSSRQAVLTLPVLMSSTSTKSSWQYNHNASRSINKYLSSVNEHQTVLTLPLKPSSINEQFKAWQYERAPRHLIYPGCIPPPFDQSWPLAMAETLGHKTARDVWCPLEASYSHDSVERVHTLRDSLRHLQKGSSIVAEFSCLLLRLFLQPNICYGLAPPPLGALVTTTTVVVLLRVVVMVDVLLLCRTSGHYATQCPDLQSFTRRPPVLDANLAQAFQAQCHVSGSSPDWYVDSGVSAHMTPSSSNLDFASTYSGNKLVLFGNGNASSISNVGSSILSPNIALLDVLLVPHLTKSLLSINKLTMDNPVDVLFSNDNIIIQNRLSKETLARGRRKNGLYVLDQGQHAFLANLTPKRLRASYDL
ncbi:hypothetical protein Tco_0481748 [Tanacetum coccineum]